MVIVSEERQVATHLQFKKPLSHSEIFTLLEKATSEYNKNSEKNRKELPFFKRLVARHDIYHVYRNCLTFGSYDGKAPMKLLVGWMYDPEDYPDAKYEKRYIIYLLGLRDIMLYFNVIPGIAAEDQFATEIRENQEVSYLTIKANMKSKMRWKMQQAKFLEALTPIIERLYQEMKKWGYQYLAASFFILCNHSISETLISIISHKNLTRSNSPLLFFKI